MGERVEQLSLFGLPAEPQAVASSAAAESAAARDVAAPAPSPAPPLPGLVSAAEGGPALPVPGQVDLYGVEATRSVAIESLASRARACRRCGLRDGCRGVVFGEGAAESGLLFLGEGPGQVEDELGRPFVGPAGQLLDKILLAVGFRRDQVYISNTVLCRPPGNRVPAPDEVAACRLWLDERLAVMRPPLIVCLGASAAKNILGPDLQITRDRGRWYSFGEARVMPTFHPAALLRDPSKKRSVWEDMKLVRAEWLQLQERRKDHPARN